MEQKRNRKVLGSWLMDEKSLKELEGMAQSIYAFLKEKQKETEVNNSEENLNSYSWNYLIRREKEPTIKVVFADESSVKKTSFQEIYDLLEIRKKLPRKITISLECIGIGVDICLSSGDYNSNYFSYEVNGDEKYPNHNEYKNTVIGKIENWIDEFKPNILSTIWYFLAGCSTTFMILAGVVAWIIAGAYSISNTNYYKQFDFEVSSIIEEGITESNRDRVMELLLMKQYEYVPNDWIQKNSASYSKCISVCIIIFAASLFIKICPKSNFSIGRGKRRVKFWKQYRNILFVAIPTTIIIPVIINLLT